MAPVASAKAPTFEAVKSKIDAANSWSKDGAARNIVDSLSADAEKALGLKTENLLVATLLDGKPSDADLTAINKLYRVPTYSSPFRAGQRQYLDRMIASIRGDADIRSASRNWAELSSEKRVAVVQKIAGIASNTYGMGDIPFKTFSDPPTPEGFITLGYVSKGEFNLNTDPAALRDFGLVTMIAVHEISHLFQQILGVMHKQGKIPHDHAFANSAESFWLNLQHYVQPKVSHEIYQSQPMEENSRWASAVVVSGLQAQGKPSILGPGRGHQLVGRVREINGKPTTVTGVFLR